MIDRCRVALLGAAAAYLALLPTGVLSFWRSLAFATSAILTIVVVTRTMRDAAARVPLPGRAIPLAVLAWALWSCASLAWSVDPRMTLAELKPDVLWGVVTMAIFYVATTASPHGFGALAWTTLAAFAFWTALGVGIELSWIGWDARPFHRGDGAFATWLVTAAPFLLLTVWSPPVGLRTLRREWVPAALLFALLIVTARLSENRIVWVALAAAVAVVAVCVPASRGMARKLAGIGAVIVVFALLFGEAAIERAAKVRPVDGSVPSALADDPRFAIWTHARERIGERPWLGYGYGLHILGREIGSNTGDVKVMHPHNLLASQWLQTGAIGAALFVAMLAAVAGRFVRYVRTRDVALMRIGGLGLAVMTGYLVRNVTDDFFIRANGKLLFAALAMLLGAGALRMRALGATRGPQR